MRTTFKITGMLLAGLMIGAPAYADVETNNSSAVAFAIEAGSIAGATQGCGQDVSVFVSRVNEALNKLATNPSDKVIAMSEFQRALQQSQASQSSGHPIPCQQVMQDFNSLPIMRSDYQQTVIAELNPNMTSSTTLPPTSTTANPGSAAAAATPPTDTYSGYGAQLPTNAPPVSMGAYGANPAPAPNMIPPNAVPNTNQAPPVAIPPAQNYTAPTSQATTSAPQQAVQSPIGAPQQPMMPQPNQPGMDSNPQTMN